MKAAKKVLICPLDWGLGHAARMVEIASLFHAMGWDVSIAGSKTVGLFMQKELPFVQLIRFDGKKISYPSNRIFIFISLIWQIHAFLFSAIRDKKRLKEIEDTLKPDLVISDNRPGAYSKKTYSIYVTHQLNFSFPFFFQWAAVLTKHVHLRLIRNFQECWVPDNQGHPALAGNLSHPAKLPKNIKYIGLLSRFHLPQNKVSEMEFPEYQVLLIASGPQPQRDVFCQKIAKTLSLAGIKALVLSARPESENHVFTEILPGIFECPHLATPDFLSAVLKAGVIITRSGYSSLMDLAGLNKKVIFIPTPGQPEQLYLAKHLAKNKTITMLQQNEIVKIPELIQNQKIQEFHFPTDAKIDSFLLHMNELK